MGPGSATARRRLGRHAAADRPMNSTDVTRYLRNTSTHLKSDFSTENGRVPENMTLERRFSSP